MSGDVVQFDTNGPWPDGESICVDVYQRDLDSGEVSVTTEFCEDLQDATEFILFCMDNPEFWDPQSHVR